MEHSIGTKVPKITGVPTTNHQFDPTSGSQSARSSKLEGNVIVRKGKTYVSHPIESFYKLLPEEGALLAKGRHNQEETPNRHHRNKENSENTLENAPESVKAGGVAFTIDIGNLRALPEPDLPFAELPRRRLCHNRWTCISRPQYKFGCGIASLVAVWNFLYSTRGGNASGLPPITQEQAMTILGFQPPFEKIRFGPFTGNQTLMKWFKQLNEHFNVSGEACYLWKPHPPFRTPGVSPREAKYKLMKGLTESKTAFIYHCYNHYFVPIGFENSPLQQTDAIKDDLVSFDEQYETWLLIGDSSKTSPPILSVKFEWVAMDMLCTFPYSLNIRHPEHGILERVSSNNNNHKHKKATSFGGLSQQLVSPRNLADNGSSEDEDHIADDNDSAVSEEGTHHKKKSSNTSNNQHNTANHSSAKLPLKTPSSRMQHNHCIMAFTQ